jgi:hypothetical protein
MGSKSLTDRWSSGAGEDNPRIEKLGVGLDRAAIAKIERNLRYVADYELVALAKALKVSPLRLLR